MKVVDLLQSSNATARIVEDDGAIFVEIEVEDGYIVFDTCKDDIQSLKVRKFLCELAEARALALRELFRGNMRAKMKEMESLSEVGAGVTTGGDGN